MRRFLLTVSFLSIFILHLSSCGQDYYRNSGYIGIEGYDLYGYFELEPTYSTMGCSYDYTDFLNDYYGYVLEPVYSYVDIIPDGDALDVYIEDLGLSVIAYYDYRTGFYYGSWQDWAVVSDCEIDENIEIWIEDTGYEIYFDIVNSFSNSPYSYYCPFYDNTCENTISFTGYPI